MTKYIKDKNGKFAGSIGEGKTNPPATSPAAPSVIPHSSTMDLAHIPTPAEVRQIPNYCMDAHIEPDTTSSTLAVAPGRPSVDERSTWTVVRTQAQLEQDYLHGDKGLFTVLSKSPRSLAYFAEMEHLHADATTRAAQLRSEGKHHQAAAVEWVAVTARTMCHDFYDIYEDSSWTHDNEGSQFGAGENPTILFRDTDSQFAVIASYGGTISEDLQWNESSVADWVIPVDTMRRDAREMFTGAVIMDYLSMTGGDVQAAAIWSSLSD